MKLVIVESPTKAKTISRFLGKDYEVMSSFGHVRDLPKSELGVDVKRDFKPIYVIPTKARKTVSGLKKSAKNADSLILATDEDREGEAIAWHLAQALSLESSKSQSPNYPSASFRILSGSKDKQIQKSKPQIPNIQRIVFHEITKRAIVEALENPRNIDMNLVNAQQARRILDRLVGYKLSPFLWKKVVKGLSAGRVQSVTVRLIVEREKEIKEFKPEEYWSIEARLRQQTADNRQQTTEFLAKLFKKNDEVIQRLDIKTKEETDEIIKDLEEAKYEVENIEKKEVKRHPFPPYTTSTLQQDAWRRSRFSAKLTMRTAQQLYEGINLGKGPVGLITYMRTDSVNLSKQSLLGAKEFIEKEYGQNYHSWRVFKTKSRLSQEAHEAIRPTDPKRTPEAIKEYLDARQYKLYDLVWRRFIASQIAPARFDSTSVDITTDSRQPTPNQRLRHGTGRAADSRSYTFRAAGQILKFDGFLKVYPIKFEENELPELEKEELLELIKLIPEQHFTQPPPRYSEATLVKALEKEGIGRPSTYAPIMSTIQDRGYVEKDERKYFKPTDVGLLVNDILVKHFPKIVDIKFTVHMEDSLDDIAQGKTQWVPVLEEFYVPFEKNLEQKYEEVEKQDLTEETEEICEKCGKPMVVKLGRFGKFLACSGFPECKNTKNIEKSTEVSCPKCNKGEIIEKKSKRGRLFYGCNGWPKCDFALWSRPTGEKCPECESLLVEERKRTRCSNKTCGFITKQTQN